LAYITLCEFPVDKTLRKLKTKKKYLLIEGHRVKTYSQRYELFKKSLICVACGCVGIVMKLQKTDPESISAHFNLYTTEDILMTKDHIVPKSRGGKNILSNYQTMCAECNEAKGNNIVDKDLLERKE